MSSTGQPPAQYAFWSTPDESITVTYSLPLFHEIDFVVNEGYRRIPHGGVEIGGLLFGHTADNTIRIESFRVFECEHAFGPSFVLSDRDLDALQKQLAAAKSDPEISSLEPVGWFVSHTRSALQMSEREVSWFNKFFSQPSRVAVLVKPERFQATQFAFVIRLATGELQLDTAQHPIILPLPGRAGGMSSQGTLEQPAPSISASSRSQEPAPPATQRFGETRVLNPSPPFKSEESERFAPTRSIPLPEPFPTQPVARAPERPPTFEHPLRIEQSQTAQGPPPVEAAPFVDRPVETDKSPAVEEPIALEKPSAAEGPAVNNKPPAVAEKSPPIAASSSVTPAPWPGIEQTPQTGMILRPEQPATSRSDGIWKERVETLPVRPAPLPAPTAPSPSRTVGPATKTVSPILPAARQPRREPAAPPRSRFGVVFLLAALLGLCVGYLAYLQLPPPVIPVMVRPEATKLIVSWPAEQTQHVADATLRVGTDPPVTLTPEEKTAGEASVSTDSNDIRIELVAHHWPRDSRGIVRLIRSLPSSNQP